MEGQREGWKGGLEGGKFEIDRGNFNSVFRFPPWEYKNVLIFPGGISKRINVPGEI